MQITLDLPDDLTSHADPARDVIEALAIRGYRTGQLSGFQARRLLGYTRLQFDAFLKTNRVEEGACTIEDLERDLQDLSRFESRILSRL